MIQIVEREDFLRIADKETALIIIRDTTCCGDEALHIVSMATLTDEMPEWVDIVGCWVGMRCYKPETLYDILSEYKQCGERVESWEDHYPADASYYIYLFPFSTGSSTHDGFCTFVKSIHLVLISSFTCGLMSCQ